MKKIAGTPEEKGVFLDRLAKVPREEQGAIYAKEVKARKSREKKGVRGEKPAKSAPEPLAASPAAEAPEIDAECSPEPESRPEPRVAAPDSVSGGQPRVVEVTEGQVGPVAYQVADLLDRDTAAKDLSVIEQFYGQAFLDALRDQLIARLEDSSEKEDDVPRDLLIASYRWRPA